MYASQTSPQKPPPSAPSPSRESLSFNDLLGTKQYLIAFVLTVIIPAFSAFGALSYSQAQTNSKIENLEQDSKSIRVFISENKQERREQINELKSVVVTRPEFERFAEAQKREIDLRFDANDRMLNLIYSEIKAGRK